MVHAGEYFTDILALKVKEIWRQFGHWTQVNETIVLAVIFANIETPRQ